MARRVVTLNVAFVLSDPLADEIGIKWDAPENTKDAARLRAHLHALKTQPNYREWFLRELPKRKRVEHIKAADLFAQLLANKRARAIYVEENAQD